MRRSRRLPTVNIVSHLERFHAYTSPPMPEKGGLPTIIVTPAEASTTSDFEIHFYSPKPSQTFFPSSTSQGFFPRMRLFFRRPAPMPSPQALMEKADYFDGEDEEEEDIAEARHSSIVNSIPRITVTSPARHGEYVALEQDDEEVEHTTIPGVPTISEEQWTAIRSFSSATGPINFSTNTTLAGTHKHNHRLLTRKVRALLFLSVPVALVAFHLITHQMGLFPGSMDGDDAGRMWSDESGAPPLAGLGL